MSDQTLTVNGAELSLGDDWADETLLAFLRHRAGLCGARFGCGVGLCGACTVLLDGEAVRACTLPASAALGRRVMTVEGFEAAGGLPAAVLRAWDALGVAQCGFCQPGQMATAASAMAAGADAEATEQAMATVLCRCGTQPRIRAALARVTAGQGRPG